MPKIVLGFIGLPCSGSGTATDYLVKKHRFFYTSTSDEIREELRERNREITRDSLQRLAGELRQDHGPMVLAQRAWEKILSSKKEKAIVDAIRGIEEVEFLKQQPNFHLVAVLAKPRIRFERMVERTREKDPTTWEEFLKTEERDRKSEGRNVEACLAAADFKLNNETTVEELNRGLKKILTKIESSRG